MRISDWSSDVCSSDLRRLFLQPLSLAGEGSCEAYLLSASPSVDGPAGGLADRGISLSLLERRAIWIGMHDAAAGYGPLPSGSTWIRRLIGVFADGPRNQIGRAHVLTPVTNAHLVCLLLL